MPAGLQRTVRRALLTLLKSDAGLTALVPAASINPLGEPVWPFILLRAPVTQPRRVGAVPGADVAWDAHAFAGPRESSGAVVESGEDHAGRIGAAMETTLADSWITLEDGSRAKIVLTDIRLLPDEDADHWHWFAQVNARVLADDGRT